MKRIRLFEAFNTDDYYQETTGPDFSDLLTEYFSKKNLEVILNILNTYVTYVSKEKEKFGLSDNIFLFKKGVIKKNDKRFDKWDGTGDIGHIHINPDGKTIVEIFMGEDEWYLVRISSFLEASIKFYKCDQIEGLKKLLHDKSI
jgi:hypothetical protein